MNLKGRESKFAILDAWKASDFSFCLWKNSAMQLGAIPSVPPPLCPHLLLLATTRCLLPPPAFPTTATLHPYTAMLPWCCGPPTASLPCQYHSRPAVVLRLNPEKLELLWVGGSLVLELAEWPVLERVALPWRSIAWVFSLIPPYWRNEWLQCGRMLQLASKAQASKTCNRALVVVGPQLFPP